MALGAGMGVVCVDGAEVVFAGRRVDDVIWLGIT